MIFNNQLLISLPVLWGGNNSSLTTKIVAKVQLLLQGKGHEKPLIKLAGISGRFVNFRTKFCIF